MESIKDILSSHRAFGGIKPENLMILDYVCKKEINEFSRYCQIWGLDKRRLVIKIENPVIKNEIFIKKDQILKKINGYFKTQFIVDIIVI